MHESAWDVVSKNRYSCGEGFEELVPDLGFVFNKGHRDEVGARTIAVLGRAFKEIRVGINSIVYCGVWI